MNLDNSTVESFTRYMKKYAGMYQNLASIFHDQLKDKKELVILDIGCGPGLLLRQLHQMFPLSILIGVDVSSEMLNSARDQLNELKNSSIFLSKTSSEALPYKSNRVDGIVSRYSLPYWPHPDIAFSEIYRVLKPGGVLVLEALNADFSKLKLQLIKYKMMFRNASEDVISYHIDAYKLAYSLEQIKEFCNSAQLNIEKVIGSTSDWKFIIIARKE